MNTHPKPHVERAIRRSDVIFMYDNPERYAAYECTVLGWAGHGDVQHVAQAHAAGVRLYAYAVGFRTEFSRMIDFSGDFLEATCRDLSGEPFIVPWLWDHVHKGQPAWWFCTNSPLYRAYLESRLVQLAAAHPDGLHIDDYTGTAGTVTRQIGCFCRHCMAGFSAYLAEHTPQKRLDKLGIRDLATFDYRQFLLERGVTRDAYNEQRAMLPLAAEFYDFQVKASDAYVAQYHQRAQELCGKPLTLCVNSGLSTPEQMVIAPQLSYFCCEVGHDAASRRVPTHPIYVYKLGDGLDRPVASTAAGQDWAYVMEHNLPGLVRTWIALSYAFGHALMAPQRQWCYTQDKGTHWYDGPTDEYAPLYRFIRRQARLLDGYEAAAPVAVVYGNAARRSGRGDIEAICARLAEDNVPFTVVIAGDDWLDYRLGTGMLDRFKAVVVAGERELDTRTHSDARQAEALDQAAREGRLVVWPDRRRLDELVPAPVVVEGSKETMVVPRIRPEGDGPAVVHLLNRCYAVERDEMVPQKDLTVRLRRELFDAPRLRGRRFFRATMVAPQAEADASPVELDLDLDDTYVSIRVPQLDLWAVVELND